jgi:pimeloyl-ACP methyl ester carboxylesterase
MPSVRIGRQEIAYREVGEGRAPILLLHGAGGSSWHWAGTIACLGGRRRCVAPDLPGHGRSPAFDPAPSASELCERYRDLVAELAERLGLGRFILCGHSLGGAVALQLALAFPDRLERLVLVATAARLPVAAELHAAIRRDRGEELRELLAATGYSPSSPRARRERWAREQIQAPREALLADFRACDTLDLRDRLEAVAVPTTVISAADDRITPPSEQERLAVEIRGARLERIGRAGHFVLLERPDALADLILPRDSLEV